MAEDDPEYYIQPHGGEVLTLDLTLLSASKLLLSIIQVPNYTSPIAIPHLSQERVFQIFDMLREGYESGNCAGWLATAIAALSHEERVRLAVGSCYLGIDLITNIVLAQQAALLAAAESSSLASLLGRPSDWSSPEEASTARLRNGLPYV